MNRVWIINQFANLPSGSSGTRHYSLAIYLKDKNWLASIISGSIEHNTGIQRLNNKNNIKFEVFNEINFLWLKLSSHKLGSLKSRAINMIYFSIKLIFLRADRFLDKPNLIIGSSPNPFAALASYFLSKRYKVPFIYEVRDLWPKTLFEMNVINSSGIIFKILDLIDTFLAKKSSKIIVLMPGAKDFYKEKGISENKVVWISNGVEYKEKILKNKIKKKKFFMLTYMGSLGPANSIETILHAMFYVNKIIKNKTLIHLKIFGSGAREKKLTELSNKLRLENISFEKPVPKYKVHKILSASDALILAMNNLPGLYKYGVSFNKIFDYLLSARPVLIASCAKFDIIKSSSSGLISNAGNHIMLGKNIIKMTNLTETEKNKFGTNGRNYVLANFLYKDLSEKLVKVLNDVIKSN